MHNKMTPRPKEKTDIKAVSRRLLVSFKPYLPWLIFILVLAIVSAVFSIFGPKILGSITNHIEDDIRASRPIDVVAIGKLGGILLTLFVVGFLFSYLQKYILAGVSMRITKKFRGDIATKINALPFSYFDKASYGDILSRITNDVDTIATSLSSTFTELISTSITLIGTFIMMLIVSPALTLIVIAFMPLTIGTAMIVMKKTQPMYNKQQESLGKINGKIEETFTCHEIVKAYTGESSEQQSFDALNDELYGYARRAQFLSRVLEPLMNLFGNIALVTLIVAGAVLSMKGNIGIGDIQSMCIYMMMFTGPVTQLAQLFTQFQSALSASGRVFAFLDEAELEPENVTTYITPSEVKGDVAFEHVHFGYDKDTPIIKDFSATIPHGAKVAIVGPTGAGKTTLVNLIMRFYELDGGKITIDGKDISTLSRANIHDIFGMVLQDTWIFKGSIRENIVYSKTDVSEQQIDKACKLAALDHFVTTLSDGYDTILDDRVSLSEGQKQLITIARAMVEDAPMLILDEATSSVDTRTEILIQNAMDELTRGRTSFIIAHRLSTIKNADLILVLKDGDIIEQGTHDELLASGGFYKTLYMSQFDGGDNATL